MKKGAIIISTIFLFSGFVFINSADLYTKKQIDQFSERLISRQYAEFESKYRKEKWKGEHVIYLADLLYSNIHVHKPSHLTSRYMPTPNCKKCNKLKKIKGTYQVVAVPCRGHLVYGAGNNTPDSYQNGFRKILANNPDFAFKAFEIYGENLIRALKADVRMVHNRKKQLPKHSNCNECWKKKQVTCDKNRPYMPNFSSDKFWEQEKELFNKYQSLISYLLTLDDKSLNYFIASIGEKWWSTPEEQGAYELKELLIEKGLYKWKGDPRPGLHNYASYPGDLLTLTYRVNLNYPEWTPRKFLQQALKFSNEVEKVL